ncbi:DUF2141 domain-containing protein [Polymorphobacter sp.]|uniref:DUF2141 domain-containing protein n=1 Tax=Polymorphobacter sp. TaxID=1909290 RepID=UPI003F712931
MIKYCGAAVAALLSTLPLAPAAAAVLGTDASACAPGARGPAMLVTITGFKDRDGNLRVQYYPAEEEDYLGSGRYIRRQEMPVTPNGDMQVCLTLPAPGDYVMVALHDRNADGKLSVWGDGIGFSNNPKIPLGKPPLKNTRYTAGPGVNQMNIVLNYMHGLSVRPIKQK